MLKRYNIKTKTSIDSIIRDLVKELKEPDNIKDELKLVLKRYNIKAKTSIDSIIRDLIKEIKEEVDK